MGVNQSQSFSNCLVHFYKNVPKLDRKATITHINQEGHGWRNIFLNMQKYNYSGDINLKKRLARIPTKSNTEVVRRVKKIFTNKTTTSVRLAARKLKPAKSTISLIKVHKAGIVARTWKKFPRYVQGQEHRAKSGCWKVYKIFLEKILVIYGELNVMMDYEQNPDWTFFYSSGPSHSKVKDKFQPVAKFPQKDMVWQRRMKMETFRIHSFQKVLWRPRWIWINVSASTETLMHWTSQNWRCLVLAWPG